MLAFIAECDLLNSLPEGTKLACVPVQASMRCIRDFGKLLDLGCVTSSISDAGAPLQHLSRNLEYQNIDTDFFVHGGHQVHVCFFQSLRTITLWALQAYSVPYVHQTP